MKYENISIVCCYTSKDKLSYLARSLDRQDLPVERVFVDNAEGQFSSASCALNYGASRSTGDLILFCHQDIKFKHNDSLRRLVAELSILNSGDVGGVAGAISGKTFTRITHGNDEEPYPIEASFPNESIRVETVDECLIILPRTTWENHRFNEDVCDGWHFYGVEQSLFALANNRNVYVFDADVNHLSSRGSIDNSYFRALRRIMKAFKQFDYISTTVGYWPRRFLELVIVKRKIKERMRSVSMAKN